MAHEPLLIARFTGSDAGQWRVTSINAVQGVTAPIAGFLDISNADEANC